METAAERGPEPADAEQTFAQPGERPAAGPLPAWLADLAWFALIAAVALALRVVYVVQLQSSPFFSHHELDERYHVEWARAFAQGREREFLPTAYFRAPLYPWFLGSIYALFGPSELIPRLAQALIGALSCGLVFVLGRMTFGRIAGVIAGLGAATYWVLLYFDGALLMESLYCFQLLLLLVVLVAAGRRRSATLWLFGGLLLGLAAITRPNILLLAPLLVLWILLLYRPGWGRRLAYAACLFVGCLVPILPITVRNWVVGRDLVLIASQGGVNFYIGNNPQSDGVSARIPGDPGEWDAAMKAQTQRAERAVGRTLKPSEISRWYTAQALRWWVQQPAAAAAHLLYKLRCFWTFWEIPNDHYIPFITRNFTPIVRYLPFSFTQPELGFAILAPLGALGVLLSMTRGRALQLLPLWGFVLVYMFSVVLFFVNSRFRAPVLPVLIVMAGGAAVWLVQQIQRPRPRALLGAAVVLAGMGWLTAQLPRGVDLAVDHNMIWSTASAGQMLFSMQDEARARALLEQAASASDTHRVPLRADAWMTLGMLRLQAGELPGAQHCFENAIRAKPDEPVAFQNLGVALAGQGKLREAADAFEQVLRMRPTDAKAQANLGNALLQLGQTERGLELLLGAMRTDRSAADSLAAAAEALVRQGRQADALRVLDAGEQRAPENLHILTPLIQLLAIGKVGEQRDPERAVQLAERALRLSRGRDPVVLHAAATALWAAGRPQPALELANQALQLAQKRKDQRLTAQIYALTEQIERAVDPNAP